MADNQSISFAESIREARQHFASELSARAEQIRKLMHELTELQELHERTGQEGAQKWDEIAHVATLADAAAAAPKVSPDSALEDVLGAVRNLVTCTIPEQVFDVLTEEAAQWNVRTAIFDVRGKAAWGASAHGFGPGLSQNVLRSLIIQLGQDTPFRQVCETAGPVETTAESLKKNRNVLEKLKPAPRAPILLLPVRSTGAVSAIFYADPGEKSSSLPVNALKILAEFAGAQIDRLIALSGGVSEEETVEEEDAQPAEVEAPVKAASVESPAVEPPAAEPAESHVPETLQPEPVHVEPPLEAPTEQPAEAVPEEPAPVEEAVQVTPPAEEAAPAEAPVEPPAADVPVMGAAVDEVHQEVEATEPVVPEPAPLPPPVEVVHEPPEPAPPSVESQPALPETEPHVEVHDAVPPPPVAVVEAAPPPPPAGFDVTQLSEADQKVHKDARRFARLLVSEIELYNKAKVADGRRNRDLYKRLKSDIDRSRQTFDKRFGKLLSKQFDYLHDELVKTLAGNDASLLGTGYPGPIA